MSRVACLAVCVLGVLASGCGSRIAASSTGTPVASSSPSGACPRGAEKLPGDAVARAADQARIEVAALYGAQAARGAYVDDAIRANEPLGPRESEVRHQCGARIARRTVVVDLTFPALLPSASLSQ